VLAASALAVGADELARHPVHHRADDRQRGEREQPVADVVEAERVAVEHGVRAHERHGGEQALHDGMAQPEEERVRRRPQEQVGQARVARAAEQAHGGHEHGGERDQALEGGLGRVIENAAHERHAERLGEHADDDQRDPVGGHVAEQRPQLGDRGREHVEHPERTGDATPVERRGDGR
jgi:hypothetical protein